jgi:hypothetical protein
MQLKRLAVTAVVLLGLAGTAGAQQAPSQPQVDVSRLPLDLYRIERQVRQSASSQETREGLNLRYQIEVFGRAPDIKLFTPEDNLTTGPVPYGAPTHREMINQITPQEFRSPVMDFNALVRWLAEKSKK